MGTRCAQAIDGLSVAGFSGSEIDNVALGKILHHRIRYFTDGAIIGSRDFVNRFFEASRQHFSPNRKTGARRMRGHASPANDLLWTARDLRKHIHPEPSQNHSS
jgi:hypothetical protein